MGEKRLHINIPSLEWNYRHSLIQQLTLLQEALFIRSLNEARLSNPPGQFTFLSWRELSRKWQNKTSDKTLKKNMYELQSYGLLRIAEPEEIADCLDSRNQAPGNPLITVTVVNFDYWQGQSRSKTKQMEESIDTSTPSEGDEVAMESVGTASCLRMEGSFAPHSYPVEGVHKDKDKDKDSHTYKDKDPNPKFTYDEPNPPDPSNGDGNDKGNGKGFSQDCSPLGEEKDNNQENCYPPRRRPNVRTDCHDEHNGLLRQMGATLEEKLEYELDENETLATLRQLVEKYSQSLSENEILRDIKKWRPDPKYRHLPWWDQVDHWFENKVSLKERDRNKGY